RGLPGAPAGRTAPAGAAVDPGLSRRGRERELMLEDAPVDAAIGLSFPTPPPAATHRSRTYSSRELPPGHADLEQAIRLEPDQAAGFLAPGSAARPGRARLAGLPDEVAGVVRDWFALREPAGAQEPAQRWSTGHSAEGKPERVAHTAASPRPEPPPADVLYDRVARFWRSELHVDPDDGPLPDLVPLLEDGYGAQVIVARVAGAAATAAGADALPAAETPVAAAFRDDGVPFIFVNAARPVVLQRFALVHAFAHLVLGHGDVVDHRIEWSRNVPPEAAANDFAEELLAPVRAVQRWYERRGSPHRTGVDDLLDLGNAFGVSAWAALYRSRAAGRVQGKQFHLLRSELRRHEWDLLPRQAYLGGLRDTLTHLTPDEALPPGAYGGAAVLRVPAAMRAWALSAVSGGRLSLEGAAAMLRLEPGDLARQLARLGLE
ncbi:MAG: ImmA/IrrE family metallo-endopeptidase, partial [Deltaproteobacteria bacterium]